MASVRFRRLSRISETRALAPRMGSRELPTYKPRLRAATEQAAALGIFGAPTFLTKGEMFSGNVGSSSIGRASAR